MWPLQGKMAHLSQHSVDCYSEGILIPVGESSYYKYLERKLNSLKF